VGLFPRMPCRLCLGVLVLPREALGCLKPEAEHFCVLAMEAPSVGIRHGQRAPYELADESVDRDGACTLAGRVRLRRGCRSLPLASGRLRLRIRLVHAHESHGHEHLVLPRRCRGRRGRGDGPPAPDLEWRAAKRPGVGRAITTLIAAAESGGAGGEHGGARAPAGVQPRAVDGNA
jgi:hypothetical protein